MHDLIERMAERARTEYPETLAILLKGSHARGDAQRWSDVDLDVVVSTPDTAVYRTWIERHEHRLVHVSAAVESLDAWLEDAESASGWSMGLPTAETTRLLWAASDEVRALLDRPAKTHPAASQEVEDAVEALAKVRNALARGDGVGVYQAALTLAWLLPTLLVPMNPPASATHARAAIDAICTLPNVPDGFAADWVLCLGFVDCRTPAVTAAAAERLLRGVLAMLPADPAVVGDDIARLMREGTLLNYVDQEAT